MSTDARQPPVPPARPRQHAFTQAAAADRAPQSGTAGGRGGSIPAIQAIPAIPAEPSPVVSGSVHRAWVAAMTVAATAIYAGFGLVQQARFRTTTYDLVIFDQAVRSYAHLQPGIAIVKGIHNGGGPHFSILGDHWSPVIALAAPFYWLYDGPQTLLVLQGITFAAAIPFIWVFACRIAAAHVPADVPADAAASAGRRTATPLPASARYFTAAAHA